VVVGLCLICASKSSPLNFGSMISRRIKLGFNSKMRFIAFSPSSAMTVVKPSILNFSEYILAKDLSSSTMRMGLFF